MSREKKLRRTLRATWTRLIAMRMPIIQVPMVPSRARTRPMKGMRMTLSAWESR